MDEKIVLEIDISTKSVDKAFDEVDKRSEESAKKIQKDQQEAFDDSAAQQLTISVGGLNAEMSKFSQEIGDAVNNQSLLNRVLDNSVAISLGLATAFGSIADQSAAVFSGFANAILGSNKGLISFVLNLTAVEAVVRGFSEAMLESENATIRATGRFLELSSVIAGVLSFGLTFAIVKIGELTRAVGNSLVEIFDSAAQTFIRADRNLRIFISTIKSYNKGVENAARFTSEWVKFLELTGRELNFTQGQLQKAGAEIAAVGTKLGLTNDQQKLLLRTTAEYAKVTGKDVFKASVAFVSALNGQSQSVLAYGVKLNETSIQQELLKNGVEQTFRSMADGQKVQVRFNSLLGQAEKIYKTSIVAATSLADAGNKLAVNQERLAIAFGKGAAVVERNNILNSVYAGILDTVNKNVLSTIGFLGAMAGRIFQVGGIVLAFSFQIVAVTKALSLLNLFLAKDATASLFARSIPKIGLSLNQIILRLTGTSLELKRASDILKVFGLAFRKIFRAVPGILATAARSLVAFLIPLTPIILKVGLIILAFQVLINAFKRLEAETQVFSRIFAIFTSELNRTGGVMDQLKTVFSGVATVLKNAFAKAVGIAIFSLSGLLQIIGLLVEANPFGVFSDNAVKAFRKVNRDLQSLNKRLVEAKFNVRLLRDEAFSSEGDMASIIPVNLEELQALKDALADVGKTDLQLLQEDRDGRLDLINRSLEQELLSTEQFGNLQEKILLDFSLRKIALERKTNSELNALNKQLQNSLTTIVKQGVASIGASLVQGSNAFKSFGKNVLGIIGDLLINIGFAMTGIGKAIEALRVSLTTLTGGFAIAAGFALIAFGGLLKSLGTGGIGVAGGGTSVGPSGAPEPDGQIVGGEDGDVNEKITKVAIDVQGTVLDPVAVGNQIAEILNDTFDAGGTKVVTA